VAIAALMTASSATALDETRIPESMRAHPVTPLVEKSDVPSNDSEQLAPLDHPDYGDSPTIGSAERDRLNQDAIDLASDVDQRAAELADGNREEEDALKKCVKDALWDVAFDAQYDQNNSQQFNLLG
jgi:hypothetical protein